MKKMKLELDALTVESFETAGGSKPGGTVHGHVTAIASCPGNDTCDAAENTCYESCACGTAYPDYCPRDTFQLKPSCMDTCNTCVETCRTCTCITCFC